MLEGEGFLEREPGSRRYVPGARLVRLGLISSRPRCRAAPRHAILEALSQQIGETCNFGIMAGNHLVYLDRVKSAWPFGLRFEPGLARAASLHVDGQAVPQPAARAQARADAALDPALPLHRKHHYRRRPPAKRNWRRFDRRKFPPTTRNFWRGWCASPFRFTARRSSRSRRWRFRRRWRVCRCNRAWRTFRCCGPRRQQPGCDDRAGWKFERRGEIREPELRGCRRDPENHRQQFLRRTHCRNRRYQAGCSPERSPRPLAPAAERAGPAPAIAAPPRPRAERRRTPSRRPRDRQRPGKRRGGSDRSDGAHGRHLLIARRAPMRRPLSRSVRSFGRASRYALSKS